MIQDGVVNYVVDKIKDLLDMEDGRLKEKTVVDGKIKLKYEKYGMKHQTEIADSQVPVFIYENLLDRTERDMIMCQDFVIMFKEYMDTVDLIETRSEAEEAIERIVDDLFDGIEYGEKEKIPGTENRDVMEIVKLRRIKRGRITREQRDNELKKESA